MECRGGGDLERAGRDKREGSGIGFLSIGKFIIVINLPKLYTVFALIHSVCFANLLQ